MSLHIAICDDEQEEIEKLTALIKSYDTDIIISAFKNGRILLDELSDTDTPFDIIFLDIYMPGPDGIKTAKLLRENFIDTKIIFVSSSRDHYPQAYDVFAFNYLEKPVERSKLFRVLDAAVREIGRKNAYKISFSYKSTSYTIDCCDICYIESFNKRVMFHLYDNSIIQCCRRLDDVEKDLPKPGFIRCHQSFIVNSAHIHEMGVGGFRVGQSIIAISKRYAKTAREQYFSLLFSKMNHGGSLDER